MNSESIDKFSIDLPKEAIFHKDIIEKYLNDFITNINNQGSTIR
jgi:hypothetical protein